MAAVQDGKMGYVITVRLIQISNEVQDAYC